MMSAPPPQYEKPPPYSPYYDPNNPQQQGYPQPVPQPYPQQAPPLPYGSPYQQPQPLVTGYLNPHQPQFPGYGSTILVQQQPEVVFVGGCPVCHHGILEDSFTVCGTLMAICFFPLGILCCLAMREKRCSHCGATFD